MGSRERSCDTFSSPPAVEVTNFSLSSSEVYLEEVFGEGGEGRGNQEVVQSPMFLWAVVTQVHKVLNTVVGLQVEQLLTREGGEGQGNQVRLKLTSSLLTMATPTI